MLYVLKLIVLPELLFEAKIPTVKSPPRFSVPADRVYVLVFDSATAPFKVTVPLVCVIDVNGLTPSYPIKIAGLLYIKVVVPDKFKVFVLNVPLLKSNVPPEAIDSAGVSKRIDVRFAVVTETVPLLLAVIE